MCPRCCGPYIVPPWLFEQWPAQGCRPHSLLPKMLEVVGEWPAEGCWPHRSSTGKRKVVGGRAGSEPGPYKKAGRIGHHPRRYRPGAKRGKRRKSLRLPIKFADRPSIEAESSRNHQKVFFSFGPCTARFLFFCAQKKRKWGVHLPSHRHG